MTVVSLLFLLLLSMASFLVYRAAEHIIGHFFRLPRAAFHIVCISCAAVFFAVVCAGGLISIHTLRGTEYARGVADAQDAAAAEQTVRAEQQRAAAEASWKDGYGEGFSAGFASSHGENVADDTSVEAQHSMKGQENRPPEEKNSDSSLEAITPAEHETDVGVSDSPSDTGGQNEVLPDNDDDTLDSPINSSETQEDPISDSTTVYYTAGGSVLHRDRNCSYLKKAKEVLSCGAADAPDLPPCSRCGS